MKYWIGFAVVAVHALLLVLFFGPWSSHRARPGRPAAPPGTAAAVLPGHAPGTPGPAPALPPAIPGAGWAGHRALPPAGRRGPAALLPTFFTPAIRALPPKPTRRLLLPVRSWSTGRRAGSSGARRRHAQFHASPTKMMTVLVVMQDLDTRTDLDLTTPIVVTREAALVGGRQVWLDPRETFPLQDILRCTLIHSANDAAFLLAQRFAGSEVAFVKRMQDLGTAHGLTSFAFHNAHGLPEGPTQLENTGSAIELAYLAGCLLQYPRVVEWTGTRVSYLEPRVDGKRTQLVTTNRLVGRVPGVNGMKTGFTDKSGYCLAATCDRGGRQVIAIATGCARSAERDDLVAALIEWAYSAP